MAPTVEHLCDNLIRSRLFPAHQVGSLGQLWQAEAGEQASNPRLFVRWLLDHRYLTRFQVKRLLFDHTEHLIVGGYKILDRLGKGDLGKVYKALTPEGDPVALKILPPSRALNAHWLKRFDHEARLMRGLSHPHVIRTLDHGESEGIHFMVMEYAEGKSLDQVLGRRKRLPYLETAHLLYQALLGLDYLFKNGLIHGNLKPTNLLLVHGLDQGEKRGTAGVTVKLLDVGVGSAAFRDQMAATKAALKRNGVALLKHCADYLAPEVVQDPRHLGIRADIYSLGCILYRCLTGQLPFPDHNSVTQVIRLQTEIPKPLLAFDAKLPDGLQGILDHMLDKDPAKRYPNPEKALDALGYFLLRVHGLVPSPGLKFRPQTSEDSETSDVFPYSTIPPG